MTREEVERIFDAYGPMVLRRARTLLGDEDEAKDVMQEVFMKALTEHPKFEVSAQAASWLYRVTTNTCLNQLRNSRRRRALVQERAPEEPALTGDSELALLARQLLAEADERWARAAVMVHVDGMSYQEASEALGVSTRSVSNFLTRFRTFALERLRRAS
jgi:RNA polymerase sigma factor (sigma-70 family)